MVSKPKARDEKLIAVCAGIETKQSAYYKLLSGCSILYNTPFFMFSIKGRFCTLHV